MALLWCVWEVKVRGCCVVWVWLRSGDGGRGCVCW